jgi:hypothetical protein
MDMIGNPVLDVYTDTDGFIRTMFCWSFWSMGHVLRSINNQKTNWLNPLWMTEVDRAPFLRDCEMHDHHISIFNYK